MTIHVVGNLCLDTTLAVARFPAVGETTMAQESTSGLGGKGVNQAVAAARAGASVVLHAAVGQADADAIVQPLASEGRLALRLRRCDGPSDTSVILLRSDGENMIVSAGRCAKRFSPAEEAGWAAGIAAGDIVLMQGNLSAASTAGCLSAARRQAAATVLNPSPLWHAQESAGAPPWRDIDWLVVNAGELRAISGEDDPARGAAVLRDRGVPALAVTLGRRGAFIADADGRFDVAAPDVPVRDTSGAGDVFCGVLVALLSQGIDRGTCLMRAVAAASLSVTRPGALASCPSAEEIAALAPLRIERSRR